MTKNSKDDVAAEEQPTPTSAALGHRSNANLPLATTLLLAANSLGIIYGDIGTSPLYVFNAIFPSAGPVPSEEDTIGALSAIIWSISLVPLLKYAWIALEFGNSTGEGGPFAVYTALYPPVEESDDRSLTNYTTGSVRTRRGAAFFEHKATKVALYGWVLFATCLTVSDGLLTPAVSVVSAVEGLAIGAPKAQNDIVGISIGILVALFLFQFLGTKRVGFTFAPIVAIWLATIGISGIINIVKHPGVFRAFDPSRAIMLFVRTKDIDLMSGVLLAITGVEAMFANLGQFSKGSIRLAFTAYVYPCLLLAYLGQGAKLIVDGENVLPNAFFNSIPGGTGNGLWWFTWILSVLAAVIASQAMISATFSLVQQLTRLHAMPAFKVVHTADNNEGQVFAPAINILIMCGTIGVTAGFGTDSGLTNAYGFAVSGVLFITTTMLAISIVRIKHLPILLAVVFFVLSGFVDGLFWGSSLKKVPHGAWFPLGLAVILCIMFTFWSWAKGLEDTFDKSNRHRLHEFLVNRVPTLDLNDAKQEHREGPDDAEAISDAGAVPSLRQRSVSIAPVRSTLLGLVKGSTHAQLVRLPVFALFHNSSAATLNGAPHSFSAFLSCYPSLPQIVVFFNIRVVGLPHIGEDAEERFVVSRVRSFEGIYIATMRLGYRDAIDLRNVAKPIRDRIVALEGRAGPQAASDKAAIIDSVMENSVTHILPNFHVSAKDIGRGKIIHFLRSFLIETIFRRVQLNFDEYDAYIFGNDEDVLRIGVSAGL